MKLVVIFTTLIGISFAQESFNCPDDYGFYPHSKSCDRYWKCENNVAEIKLCGNGLAFDATDPKYLTENCDYLHNVDCGDRTQLEAPIGTKQCPRLFGIFADEQKCNIFWSCWDGEAKRYECAPGLAYDRDAKVCMWADQVPECRQEEVAGGFSCPAPGEVANTGTFSRHAHPDDCRKYYVCLDGTPREYGCPIGTVFKIADDDVSGHCSDPEEVPGCEDYYGELDLKALKRSELLLGLGGNDGNGNNGNNGNTGSVNRPLKSQQQKAPVNNGQQQRSQPQIRRPAPQSNVQSSSSSSQESNQPQSIQNQ